MKYEDFGYFTSHYNIWRRSNSLFINVGKCLIHSRARMLEHFWDIHWNGQDLGYENNMVEGLSKGVDGCCFDFISNTDSSFVSHFHLLHFFRLRSVEMSITVDWFSMDKSDRFYCSKTVNSLL